MGVHLDSPCKQCYFFDKCHAERKSERNEKQKEWIKNGKLIGMSTTDCFKSPQEYKKDYDNLPQWKKDELEKCRKLSCWGSYDSDTAQCMSHCKGWVECSKETLVKYDC